MMFVFFLVFFNDAKQTLIVCNSQSCHKMCDWIIKKDKICIIIRYKKIHNFLLSEFIYRMT